MTQENTIYKQFLSTSNKKAKMSTMAQTMVEQMEKKMCVRSFLPNIFPVPPIFRGNNPHSIQRLNLLLLDKLAGENFLLNTKAVFSYYSLTRRVTINVPRHTCILITQHLAHILGFGEKTHFVATSTGVFIMDPFTDAIQERCVGDMQVPLLRCVAVDRSGKRRGGMQSVSFPHLDYFPLKSKRLDEVSIYLRDRSGQPIPFMRGEVTVTLHVRPIER